MIFEIFKLWQVIVICAAIMIILPLIFYVSSFDNRPIRIKKVRKTNKVKDKRRKKEDNTQRKRAKAEQDDDGGGGDK